MRTKVLFSRVLVVDGDPERARETLRQLFPIADIVETADTPRAAELLAATLQPDLVLLEGSVEDQSDVEIVWALKRVAGTARVLIALSEPNAAAAAEAVRRGALGVVTRPISLDGVLAELARATTALLAQSLELRHWEALRDVLAACRGNRSEAARRLGIPRRSLQRILERSRPSR